MYTCKWLIIHQSLKTIYNNLNFFENTITKYGIQIMNR